MTQELFPWLEQSWGELRSRRASLPDALLLHGRSGLGKTVLARLFAKRLLCEGPAAGDLPCGECPACLWFEQGNHPDFRVLEPEALSESREPEGEGRKREGETASRQIRIDQVRDLQGFLAIGTHRGGIRVVVVRPAEAMNGATANALLKSLEEPPPRTLFLLVSSTPDRLLPTVRSRCQKIGIAPASPEAAVPWLRARGVTDAEAALAYSARAPLAALEDGEERTARDALIAGRLASGSRDALELADACQGVPPARVIVWMQKWAVDMALARTGGTVRYHLRQATALQRLAGSLALDRLLRFERSLAGAAAVSQHPLNPRLVLEDVFLRYAQLWEARGG
jgi:DNA polymerase III subunit delta'